MIYHDEKTCLTFGLHKLSPFNKKDYYFKLSGDNLWVVQGQLQLLLRQLYRNCIPCKVPARQFLLSSLIFLGTIKKHRSLVAFATRIHGDCTFLWPCCIRLITNWAFCETRVRETWLKRVYWHLRWPVELLCHSMSHLWRDCSEINQVGRCGGTQQWMGLGSAS